MSLLWMFFSIISGLSKMEEVNLQTNNFVDYAVSPGGVVFRMHKAEDPAIASTI